MGGAAQWSRTVHTVRAYWCARAPTRYHCCSAPHPGRPITPSPTLTETKKWGRRLDMSPSQSIPQLFMKLNVCLTGSSRSQPARATEGTQVYRGLWPHPLGCPNTRKPRIRSVRHDRREASTCGCHLAAARGAPPERGWLVPCVTLAGRLHVPPPGLCTERMPSSSQISCPAEVIR